MRPQRPTHYLKEGQLAAIPQEEKNLVSNLFGVGWHKARLGLVTEIKKQGKVRKSQIKEYDAKQGVKVFFAKYVDEDLMNELKTMALHPAGQFELHSKDFPKRQQFLLTQAVVLSHENTSAEREMSKIKIHANKQLKLATQELKLCLISALEKDRAARRAMRMKDGPEKDAGEELRSDMVNGDCVDAFGAQALQEMDAVREEQEAMAPSIKEALQKLEASVEDHGDYIRKEMMPDSAEHVARAIVGHCNGTGRTVYPQVLGLAPHCACRRAHTRVYLVAWESYGNEDRSWETAASLRCWAAWEQHERLLREYCNAQGIDVEAPMERKATEIRRCIEPHPHPEPSPSPRAHCDGALDPHPECCPANVAKPHDRKYLWDFPCNPARCEFRDRPDVRQYAPRDHHNGMADDYDEDHPLRVLVMGAEGDSEDSEDSEEESEDSE